MRRATLLIISSLFLAGFTNCAERPIKPTDVAVGMTDLDTMEVVEGVLGKPETKRVPLDMKWHKSIIFKGPGEWKKFIDYVQGMELYAGYLEKELAAEKARECR